MNQRTCVQCVFENISSGILKRVSVISVSTPRTCTQDKLCQALQCRSKILTHSTSITQQDPSQSPSRYEKFLCQASHLLSRRPADFQTPFTPASLAALLAQAAAVARAARGLRPRRQRGLPHVRRLQLRRRLVIRCSPALSAARGNARLRRRGDGAAAARAPMGAAEATSRMRCRSVPQMSHTSACGFGFM